MPCQPPSNLSILSRPVLARAMRRAKNVASVPEPVKCTWSAHGQASTSFSASSDGRLVQEVVGGALRQLALDRGDDLRMGVAQQGRARAEVIVDEVAARRRR